MKCIPLAQKKITQPILHEAFILPSSNNNSKSNIYCNSAKAKQQGATFKTELVNKDKDKESLDLNKFNCQILKLKDEALIQSLYNYTKPKTNNSNSNSNSNNNNTSVPNDKANKKKKKRNKFESHSTKSKPRDEMEIQDVKILQLVRQCEDYFFDQSKRKSFFKKTCLICKGQCFNTNELLHFRYLKDFLQYVDYLFTYRPIIIYNEDIALENKEILYEDMKELNGAKNKDDWHFSQTKVVCKGCLMTMLNKPDCIGVLRKLLMDKKDKKKDYSDKEKELEQENDIKLQTKDINEQIARDIQHQQQQQLKKKKKKEAIHTANVFNKAFTKRQDLSSYSITFSIEEANERLNSSNIKEHHQPQTQSEGCDGNADNVNYDNQINPSNSKIPVYIPELFPQFFQNILNEILLYFNQLINESHAINQQYQSSLLTMESISSYYIMIDRLINQNHNKSQEIIQIMFNCESLMVSFIHYLSHICSINQNNDRVLYEHLNQIKDNLENEYRVYEDAMKQVLKGFEVFQRISYDYLEDMKMQYYILEAIASMR